MVRNCLLVLLCGMWPAITLNAAGATCSIQRAAVADQSVWLLCDRNELQVSGDKGKTWKTRRIPSDSRLRAIAFLDSRRGFVAGDRGTLMATDDAAETWRQIPLPTQENLTSLSFVGELGWLAGWAGVIFHSPDGGRTWHRQQSGVLQGLECVQFIDATHGWAVGWVGAILRTLDGGRNWERVRTAGTLWSLDSVYFTDPRDGWAVGFGGLILRSRDGGLTWQELEGPVRAWFRSVAFDKKSRGWIAADNNLLMSEDGGATWKIVPFEGRLFLQQVLPVNDSVWVVGQFGVLRQAGGEATFDVLAGSSPGAGGI